MSPAIEISHMSNISYKAYMDKNIIFLTLTMSALLSLQFCIHAWLPCACIYVQKCLRTQDPPQYICTQKYCSYAPWQSWVWLIEAFIVLICTVTIAITSALAATIVMKVFCYLVEPCIGSTKSILENYYSHAKFHQCQNGNPQSNFIQHSRIKFPKLWAHSGNLEKLAPRENNSLYGTYCYITNNYTYIISFQRI